MSDQRKKGLGGMEKQILDNIPAGLAMIDQKHRIVWCNRRFREWCVTKDSPMGQPFFNPLGKPEMQGPDYSPLSSIHRTGHPTTTLLAQKNPMRYLQMDSAPCYDDDGTWESIIVELHDVTDKKLIHERKWTALREAGLSLAELSERDVLSRSPKERVDILKEKIGRYAREILQFTTIEIRRISTRVPGLLEPLLAIGMTDEAKQRTLYVAQENNGITGWVAYHKRSYKMDDPADDIFYLKGIPGAQSSITAPILYGGNVIGTFNVESRQKRAFTEDDVNLLETFAMYVGRAIHTLDLFSVEQIDTTYRSIETLYRETIPLLNQTLEEVARLRKGDLDDRNELRAALSSIQHRAREIQSVFQRHGGKVAPELPQTVSAIDCRSYPMLRGRRILLVAADKSVGASATEKLFYFGCTVESATNGESALKMASTADYDIYLSFVKLPDMSAFAYFKRIRCLYCRKLDSLTDLSRIDDDCSPPEDDPCCEKTPTPFVPFIFMQEPGNYDGAHVVTRAAEAGVVPAISVELILPQLLDSLKTVLEKAEKQKASTAV